MEHEHAWPADARNAGEARMNQADDGCTPGKETPSRRIGRTRPPPARTGADSIPSIWQEAASGGCRPT